MAQIKNTERRREIGLSTFSFWENIDENEEDFIPIGEERIKQIAGILEDIGTVSSNIALYIPQENTQTKYGIFSLSAEGEYIYILDNMHEIIAHLAIGEKTQDSIIIQAIDKNNAIVETMLTMNIEGTGDFPNGYIED